MKKSPAVLEKINYIDRIIDLKSLLREKSHFLFGPRQTGKSSLIRHSLQGIKIYNLLDSSTYLTLNSNPKQIAQEASGKTRIIVIDEVQRLPELLNEVHLLIEERGIRFLLTGSSARKLRRGGVNLLGGRARTRFLHPLTFRELGKKFDLQRALTCGLLPSIYFSSDPRADLHAYAGSYLQEEIVSEAATRNVPAFTRFLRVAALSNAAIVNFTNVANDAQVARTTVYEYFEILKDTLIVHELPAWKKTAKRKPLASSKYYFFDIGVAGFLQNRIFRQGTPEFGEAFETFMIQELFAWRDYRSEAQLNYWRSTSGFEVDLILDDRTAIEFKARENVSGKDLKSLRALSEETTFKRLLCVCLETRRRTVDGIIILPWWEFLTSLWDGEFSP